MDSRRRRHQNGRANQDGRANQERAGGSAPDAAKSAPVAPSVKSEPVAPPPAQQVPIESAAVDEAVIAAALAPQAPEASAFVEVVELEAVPVVAAQESVAGFAISASTPIATPEAAAWAFKSVELGARTLRR